VAGEVARDFPGLNCVINNAGVQRRCDLVSGALDDEALVEEVHTNLLGIIRVTAAFLPHLRRKPGAMLINVSSGLAFVPAPHAAVYSATKAAVHSLTLSLRQQLSGPDAGVQVVEIIPPRVATHLGQPPGGPVSGGMPLPDFIAETMRELAAGADEIAVGQAQRLVAASAPQTIRQTLARMGR
jgi:uncharacterized oxidoreductase